VISPRNEPDEPVIARDATYHRAPEGLRDRILATLDEEARGQPLESQWWRYGGIAASLVIASLLTWNGVMLGTRHPGEDRLATEVTTAHNRSLMAETHLNDVLSSDRHTVKPWFSGKLDFAPVVVDLADSGYTLIGGRLDYLNGRAVAALTYRRRLHVINVFEWPASAPGELAPETASRQGYQLAHWRRGSLEYWAVTDAAPGDLAELARLLRE
jgi:anti-sigma factor RsiW